MSTSSSYFFTNGTFHFPRPANSLRMMYPTVGRVLIRCSRAAVLDAGVFMLCAGAAAGRSGAAAKDAGIALGGLMYPTIGRALSRLSVAAALDAGILGSKCVGTQDAGGQRNEHCAKNVFPNRLFHGISIMCGILLVTFSVRSRHCQNHPNQSHQNQGRPNRSCPHRYRTHP